jgi:hypothetical protein
MKFRASIRQSNDKKRDAGGLFAVQQSIKQPIPLGDYCCSLLRAAFEFAEDSGETANELNTAMDQVRQTIANLKYIDKSCENETP